MKPPKSITINGKRWRIEWTAPPRGDEAFGLCHFDEHRVQIDPKLDDELLISCLADEICHAHFSALDNDCVDEFSDNLAKILTQLGFKRDED